MIRRRTMLTTALAATAAIGLAAAILERRDPEATSAAAALAGVTILRGSAPARVAISSSAGTFM